jgi:hypothetical protein
MYSLLVLEQLSEHNASVCELRWNTKQLCLLPTQCVDVVCRHPTVITIAFSLNRNKHFVCIMKTVWAFREVGTELLLLAWFSISWGLDVIGSGLIPNESKTFVLSPKRPDQLWGPYIYIYNMYNLMSRGSAFHGAGRPECEGDFSLPNNAERLDQTSTPPCPFMSHTGTPRPLASCFKV